jgi:hypothetical protein
MGVEDGHLRRELGGDLTPPSPGFVFVGDEQGTVALFVEDMAPLAFDENVDSETCGFALGGIEPGIQFVSLGWHVIPFEGRADGQD